MPKNSKPENPTKGLIEKISNKFLGGLMPANMEYLVAAVIAIVAGFIGYFIAKTSEKKKANGIVAEAELQKKNILEEAKNNATEIREKAQKKAKEIRDKELLDRKNSERELQKKRQEIEKQEIDVC